MFHIHFSKHNLAARLAFAGLFAVALPLLAPEKALAGPAYDCNGVSIIPDPGNTTVLSFDGQLSCISVYDATVSLSGTLNAADAFGGSPTASYSYDAQDRLITETSPGDSTSLNYSGSELTSDTDTLGRTTTYTYDAGDPTKAVDDPSGNITRYDYDSQNRLETLIDPSGNTTVYDYDSAGRIDDTSLNSGTPTQYIYDAENRLTEVIDPLGHTTTYAYDAEGRVATETAPGNQVTTFTYDAEGRLASDTDPSSRITTYTYDADGLTAESDPKGVTQFVYTSAVPEPAAWIMMLVGFGGLGAVLRRNRRRDAASATA
jgi:YD repeat-containing protein